MSGGNVLKGANFKWLVLLAVVDALAVLFLIAPELIQGVSLTQASVTRLLTATIMPVVVLLVVNMLPPQVKSALVYWRVRDTLPGTGAFTKHGPADPRVDMIALKKNVGEWPTDPAGQNAMWYRLFKLVEKRPEVMEAHRSFLLYRDMASLSLPLVGLAPLGLHLSGVSGSPLWLTASLFLAQFLLAAISARWAGVGLVRNVLAAHSTKKVAAAKRPASKAAT